MPKFSNGDKVRVNPGSPSPYKGRIGTVVDDGSSSSGDLGYMVRFEWRGLHPTARFMEEDLQIVSDEAETSQETVLAGVSTEWSGQASEGQFVRVTSKTKYIYWAALAVLVIAGMIFGIRNIGMQTGSDVPTDFSDTGVTLPQGSANGTELEFSMEMVDAVAGEPFAVQPVVRVVDTDGNVIDTEIPVSLVVARDAADLWGETTVTTVNGVATFENLRMTRAGSQFQLTALSPRLTAILSNPFKVVPNVAAQLDFISEPDDSGLPNRITTKVVIEDTYGNLVSDSTLEVTLSIAEGTGPEGAVLSGVTTQKAINGIVAFNYIEISPPDQYYKLTASSPGLDPDTCESFKPELVAPVHTDNTQ